MGDCLMATVRTMPPLPVPPGSFEARRNQYYSTKILKELLGEVPQDALKLLDLSQVCEHLLGKGLAALPFAHVGLMEVAEVL